MTHVCILFQIRSDLKITCFLYLYLTIQIHKITFLSLRMIIQRLDDKKENYKKLLKQYTNTVNIFELHLPWAPDEDFKQG